jgi:ankyrin repeat protein
MKSKAFEKKCKESAMRNRRPATRTWPRKLGAFGIVFLVAALLSCSKFLWRPVTDADIYAAVSGDDVAKLRKYRDQGFQVYSGQRLLSASWHGSVEVVHYFVRELGADVNYAEGVNGASSLQTAAQEGHFELVVALVENLGANPNQVDSLGESALFNAAGGGYLTVVRYLVDELGVDVNHATISGVTALGIAVEQGHFAVVRCLVEDLGADVSQVAHNDGRTYLMVAEHFKRTKIAIWLSIVMRYESDVQRKISVPEETIVKAASVGDMIKLQRWASQGVQVESMQPLIFGAREGNLDAVRCLLNELGAGVNQTQTTTTITETTTTSSLVTTKETTKTSPADRVGATAFFAAVERGHVDVVRCLVTEFGANVNYLDDEGNTPLSIAAQEGHLNMVRLLAIELGADIGADSFQFDIAGESVHLDAVLTAEKGHRDAVRWFASELSADVDHEDNYGLLSWEHENNHGALLLAAQGGHLDVVRCLVTELGADVHQVDKEGCTPLLLSAKEGHLDVVQCLVAELGADVSQENHDGATPLYMAAQRGHLRVVQFLARKLGDRVNQADTIDHSPLYTAAQHGHLIVALYLDMLRWEVRVKLSASELMRLPKWLIETMLRWCATCLRYSASVVEPYASVVTPILLLVVAFCALKRQQAEAAVILNRQRDKAAREKKEWKEESEAALQQERSLAIAAVQAALTRVSEDESGQIECKICLCSGDIRFVSFSCGHIACVLCAKKLSTCHLCRQRIVSRTPVFF